MAGGGIGEAALIGAAFGGAKAIATGDDPLQAALLGGVTGGAMSGVTGALMGSVPAEAGAAEVVKATPVIADQTKNIALANAGVPLTTPTAAFNPVTASQLSPAWTQELGGITTAQGLGQTAAQQGLTQGASQGIAGVPGSMTPFQTAPIGMGQGVVEAVPATVTPSANLGIPTQYGVETTPLTTAETSPVANTGIRSTIQQDKPFEALKRAINPEAGGMMEKGLDWAIEHPYMASGVGGLGYGMYEQSMKKPEEMPTKKEEKSPLATFNPESYVAYEAPQPDPYPKASYVDYFNRDQFAAKGGVMRSYAQGGIAALATGGMDNLNYPGSRATSSNYDTASQTPLSQSVVDGGYEPAVNTYSGGMVGMAEGGIASFAAGGNTNPQQLYYDPGNGQYFYYNPGYGQNPYGYSMAGGFGSMFGPLITDRPEYIAKSRTYVGNPMDSGAKQAPMYVEPTPNVYRSAYQSQPTVTRAPMSMPNNSYAPTYSLGDSMGLLSRSNPAAAAQVMNQGVVGKAEGGIAGYNLGGYASGGNPRLLKGPGDGMSDNIPAVIGGRQPARLADGEFVVPADVVSHLGNGSTDAGAKHLYNMMDKVRKARTGTKKQGKQINPNKFLPA